MAIAGTAMIFLVVSILLCLFFGAFFLLWGAKIAGIENRSFGKALGVVIIGGVAALVLSAALTVVPLAGTAIGLIAGFLVNALIMMPIFDTTFDKALAASVIAWVLSGLVMAALLAVGVLALGLSFF